MKAKALTLALLLTSQYQQRAYALEHEHPVYSVVELYEGTAGWPDERRADLVALLSESITDSMTIGQKEAACFDALRRNENRWVYGL